MASFRSIWLKPEVYPLIGAMGVAVGAAGYALIGKAVKDDAYTTWSKAKRSGQVDLLEVVEEVTPLMASSKNGSIRIFGKENPILANQVTPVESTEPLKFTIRVGEEEEEEEEEEAAEEAAPADDVADAAVAVVDTVVADAAAATDEAEQTINAAIDAANMTAPAAAPASVVEPEQPSPSASS